MNERKHNKKIKVIVMIVIVLILFYFIIHSMFKSSITAIPPPKVTVEQPKWKNIVEYITQTGNLVAYNSVDLVARIEGYLDNVKFTDGSFVKKGQALLVIEPEPYREQWQAALATVAVQKATYAYNKAEYERQKRMYNQNATSLNNVQKWYAQMLEAEANIANAVANAKVAEINYSYTHIAAPFDGRIGRHLVDPGNLVGNGVATNLATIEQINPIYAYFNLNELDVLKLRTAVKAQGLTANDLHRFPVYIKLQNENTFRHQGVMDFVNTGLNASTGTLEFRALLNNPDYTLLPGLFVQVHIPVSKPTKQLTVPTTAILYDQMGAYVLTVDNNKIVQTKRVTLGDAEGGIRPVTSGLTINDKVIISGLQFATPGNPVDPN
jgi:RND family efflux transporter MFP subunit